MLWNVKSILAPCATILPLLTRVRFYVNSHQAGYNYVELEIVQELMIIIIHFVSICAGITNA